jgi:uncharacterized protein
MKTMPRSCASLAAFLLSTSWHCVAHGQLSDLTAGNGDIPAEFARHPPAADYTRHEAMIPMRDGVKLFTVIEISRSLAGPAPILLTRTPYNASRRTRPFEGASPRMAMSKRSATDEEALVRGGYIRVNQDIRGRYKSEGIYVVNRPLRGPLNASETDHATDTWDTIDWLVKNVPGNNGRVGIMGISYDGFLTLMALVDPHPALKAAVPINSMVDGWTGDDWYHNGALRQTMLGWIHIYTSTKEDDLEVPYGHHDLYSAFLEAGSASAMGVRVNADQLPAWRRLIDNPAYTPLWKEQAVQEILARTSLRVPTLTVHSLFDQEDIFGPLAAYAALERDEASRRNNFLVIGPWRHAQTRGDGSALGSIRWGSDTAWRFREKLRQAFLDEHLKGVAPARALPRVVAFETGSNEWREYDTWPPQNTSRRKLFLQPGGGLSYATPSSARESFTQYVSDPAKPVPYQVRPIRPDTASDSRWANWLADDQRPSSDRTDTISFVSPPLTEPLTVSGPIAATLFASTTGSDADWVVKLIDMYPDENPAQANLGGYQLMIAADIFRGRYREDRAVAKPIAAGKMLPYVIPLPHANHTFLPGHRLMVQIQSSWFPLYDRNPQTFVSNIAYAKPEHYRRAVHRVFHSAAGASFIELPVAPRSGAR